MAPLKGRRGGASSAPCGEALSRTLKIRGVIFDMDGTITAPNLDFVGIKAEAGIGDEVDMLDYLRSATGTECERVHKLLMRFEEGGVANAKLNRGARTLLNALAKRKIRTALLTRNSRRSVDAVCRKLKLKFDVTITREDGPHKPSPEPIWRIAKRWKAKPNELLMVGDYKWDVLCAKNAGTPCAVLVNGGAPDWAKDADFIIKRLADVLRIVAAKPFRGGRKRTRPNGGRE
jgi:HAD superfamily hydrolase (TIGR01549 family)